MWEVLTFIVVILLSPISFVFGLPFGIAPADWLATWLHWVVGFILLVFFIALLGFNKAFSYKLKAESARARLESQAKS